MGDGENHKAKCRMPLQKEDQVFLDYQVHCPCHLKNWKIISSISQLTVQDLLELVSLLWLRLQEMCPSFILAVVLHHHHVHLVPQELERLRHCQALDVLAILRKTLQGWEQRNISDY